MEYTKEDLIEAKRRVRAFETANHFIEKETENSHFNLNYKTGK